MHVPLIFLARNLASTNSIDRQELREKLQKVMKILEEAAAILELEPPDSPEGSLGVAARGALVQMQENMEELIERSFNH